MRRYRLGLLAIFSTTIAVIAGSGFFGEFGVMRITGDSHNEIFTDGGRIRFRFQNGMSSVRIVYPDPFLRFTARPKFERMSLPTATYRFGFYRAVHSEKETLLVGTFPIWCVLLPCLIAPVLWLRRRKRERMRGFAVGPVADAEQPPRSR